MRRVGAAIFRAGSVAGPPQDSLGYQAAAQDAGDGAQARPGRVADQPESGHADVVRHSMLVALPSPSRTPPTAPRGRRVKRS